MNPELRRNLWTELTPARLVAMPAIAGGIFLLAFLADDRKLGAGTSATALLGVGALTWFWGAHLAAESVLSELRSRTWDWQRMSGVAPWSLTWGKLAGSTSYPWYGALLCLAVYAVSDHGGDASAGRRVAAVLLAGLLAQATALLTALQTARRDRTFSRVQSTAWLVLASLVVTPFLSAGFAVKEVSWFGLRFGILDFLLRSLVPFTAFAVAGAWVQMRRELKARTLPLAWPAFALFLMFWVAGFTEGERLLPAGYPVGAALAVATGLTWAAAFGERKDPVALARLLRALRAERWRRAAEEAPAWLLTLPYVVALALLSMAVPGLLWGAADAWTVRWTVAAALGFLARDLALLHFLHFGARPRRADLFAAVLLLVGYALLPLIFAALKWDAATALLVPNPDHAPIAAASGLAQAAAMVWLLARRWRQRRRALDAAPGAAAVG